MAASDAETLSSMPRYPVLDGWRGISILMVLAAHQLPLGPGQWGINHAAGLLGMSLFFTLSGFLITMSLIFRPVVKSFLIRRICRILPLAWLFLMIALPLGGAEPMQYMSHLLFFVNSPGLELTTWTDHFWSLCMEMQFYLVIAFLFGWLGEASFKLLPVMAFAVTLGRFFNGVTDSIFTFYRVDEILAGACLALVVHRWNQQSNGLKGILPRKVLPWAIGGLLALLLLSCHGVGGPFQYLRPYAAASLVGVTILASAMEIGPGRVERFLPQRWLVYVGRVSYAVYLLHPLATYGWLGSGDAVVRYAKRPLVFAVTFGLAHLSTFYYEERWMKWGKAWSRSVERKQLLATEPVLSAQGEAIAPQASADIASSLKA